MPADKKSDEVVLLSGMALFTTLLLKLLPLYAVVLLGWFGGKYLAVKKESIATLLIYIIAPVVVFRGVVTSEITLALLLLPVLFFLLACFFCLAFYLVGTFIWEGSEKNILAFTAGTGNTGYFGIPVVVALFGDQFLGVAVLVTLGFVLYENSVGFFITAKGNHTVSEAVRKVLKLPALYAFLAALLLNFANLQLSPIILNTASSFLGAYTVLGMMLIGFGLADVTRASLDYVFTGIAFLAKFIAWPLVVGALIILDMAFFRFFDSTIHEIMLLTSITPLASNTVAYATALNTHPEKAALAVLLSTLFALIFIPLVATMVFPSV